MQVGHGRRELAEVAARQTAELAYFPVWGYTTPVQAELAERVADLAPGDLNRVFFTTGGGEAVESAWKAAKQYFKLIGKPQFASEAEVKSNPRSRSAVMRVAEKLR